MFVSLARKTLEIYLREKRIITQSEFNEDVLSFSTLKEAIFVTLYYEGRVIASSGRIQCKKENVIFECIDNALLCLKDERFTSSLQTPDSLEKIHIRIDRFGPDKRRVIDTIEKLDIRTEGLILLSQNLGILSVILPNMVHVGSTPEAYLELAFKKVGLNVNNINSREYFLYGLTTVSESDFE